MKVKQYLKTNECNSASVELQYSTTIVSKIWVLLRSAKRKFSVLWNSSRMEWKGKNVNILFFVKNSKENQKKTCL